MDNKCAACGKDTAGYKCDMCDAEMSDKDEAHGCGVEHCRPKCSSCNESETKCVCEPVA